MSLYKIVCITPDNYRGRTVRGMTGLYFEEVQKICRDPETSSSTAKGKAAKARSRRLGCEWFFGWTEER